MASFSRKFVFSVATACLALTLGAAPATAKTIHHKHHAKKVHHSRHHVVASGNMIIRIAQQHLANLGYYVGSIDGRMGPQTKAAIKQFQREHSLKADGVLGKQTNRALDVADQRGLAPQHTMTPMNSLPRNSMSGGDASVNPDYAPTLNGGTKVIASRYARVDVSETGDAGNMRYIVNFNGQPILTADGQPSIIGMSSTYDMGSEDSIVFTTYTPSGDGCTYKTHVLVMDGTGSKMLDLDNCTRNFQARVSNGSLYVTFPEVDDNRAIGATWRVEGMTAERL